MMKKVDKSSWPILIVSNQLNAENAEGNWMREIIHNLTTVQGCSVIPSYSIRDAIEIVLSREDLGAVVFDWKMVEIFKPTNKIKLLTAKYEEKDLNEKFLEIIKERNRTIPILIMTERTSVEDFSDEVLSKINGLIWKLSDTSDFLAGRIEKHVIEYSDKVLPPFFSELVHYVNEI